MIDGLLTYGLRTTYLWFTDCLPMIDGLLTYD